jgi:flagellar assembly factor FliW
MRLETTRFGVLDVDPGAIITFTQPIIGFPEYRRFLLLPVPEDAGLSWLQSTDSGELAFLLMDPRAVIGDYTVPLSAHDKAELALSGEGDLAVYTLVVVPPNPKDVRTNLRAPVLINRRQRLGKQTVLDRSDYPIQFHLARGAQGGQAPQEVGNARADA